MFKYVITLAALCLAASTNAGLIQTHPVVHEPVLVKVGTLVHSAPSAVSHQSITQVHHGKTIVQPVLVPVHTTQVHTAPAVVHSYAPVHHGLQHVHAAPLPKTVISPPSFTYGVHY